ncbi:MAG: glycosyltransferase family 39 protein [Crocinitomicaceae bacterium]|nr:glycosyltransferase family 39 protein [Crocinitomicaceae bacterium]
MLDWIDAHTVPYLITGLTLIGGSFILFFWNKKWAIWMLVLGSGVLAYFMAILDPFLNLWDEQQHALVAKNMASNPFKPMLIKEPVIEYDYKLWIANHIWIHKQPLFLWQMALFVKILGAKVIAIRLPSVIMHALLPYLVYRIGKSVRNETAGFIAAIFITLANYPLELVAGRYSTDHNDMAFLFYVTWSVLCWVEYVRTKERKWLIWLGISAGGAVLVKWLMGLLVYVCWFLVITIKNNFKFWQIKQYFVMIRPFLISLLVFLPWQIYCFIRFPKEAAYELGTSASHFSNVVEGHSGDWDYHFVKGFQALYFRENYFLADWMPFMVLVLLAIGIWKMKNRTYQLFMGIIVAFVYVFFSLAATKMNAFTIIVMPIVLLGISSAFVWFYELWSKYIKIQIVSYLMLGAILWSPVTEMFKLREITQRHSLDFPHMNDFRKEEIEEIQFIRRLEAHYGDQKIIAFNANYTVVGFIPLMFYTDYTAYGHMPSEQNIQTALIKGYKVVVIDRNDLPVHILQDDRLDIFPAFKDQM